MASNWVAPKTGSTVAEIGVALINTLADRPEASQEAAYQKAEQTVSSLWYAERTRLRVEAPLDSRDCERVAALLNFPEDRVRAL